MKTLRIGTRKSPLALWQAEYVRTRLRERHPDLEVELVKLTTQGDKILDTPLAKVGGKGLFVKELEEGLLAGRIDLAVHSMKDVTVTLPPGLQIAVICEREEPFDALVSPRFASLEALGEGARVGTSSLRRQCQLRHAFPHFHITDLRGNVNTRLAKLDAGDYDAIILAAAGLIRLNMRERIAGLIPEQVSLPAVGQGAVGVECRSDDPEIRALIAHLDHPPTHLRVTAERALNERLEGGCQVPIAAFAQLRDQRLMLRARVGRPDGSTLIEAYGEGDAGAPQDLGRTVAEDLVARGAGDILQEIYAVGKP